MGRLAGVDCVALLPNGLLKLANVFPTILNGIPLPLLSAKTTFWQVSNVVPLVADKGDVGGVKLPVYSAEPLITRKLLIYPVVQRDCPGRAPIAIVVITDEFKSVVDDPTNEPFTKMR